MTDADRRKLIAFADDVAALAAAEVLAAKLLDQLRGDGIQPSTLDQAGQLLPRVEASTSPGGFPAAFVAFVREAQGPDGVGSVSAERLERVLRYLLEDRRRRGLL